MTQLFILNFPLHLKYDFITFYKYIYNFISEIIYEERTNPIIAELEIYFYCCRYIFFKIERA